MTKQNQLFEAIGSIDDDIAARAIEAARHKRKKPLTLVIIAAAAAVITVLAGAAARNDDFRITFHGNNTPERGFTASLTDQQFTIPAELEPLRNEYGKFHCFVDMLPSELYEKLGLTMLTSENFTETKDVKMKRAIDGDYHTWEPIIHGSEACIDVEYCLYNKSIDANIWFKGYYVADNEKYIMQGGRFGLADEDADIVTLSDGSLAMVSDRSAAFCLDGVFYMLDFDDYKNESIATIDNMKQVLADLGIYTPVQ